MNQNPRNFIDSPFKLRLLDRRYWDLVLSNKNIQCDNCSEIHQDSLIGDFDFVSTDGTCNSRLWDMAKSFDEDVCDIGLTGYDNRFVDDLTGHVYNPMNDKQFCAYSVSGDVFCYNYFYNSGEVVQNKKTEYQEPEHVKFCGGFFQGFYKLDGYEYNTMPNEYPNGWTKEFWIKPEECQTGETCITISTGSTIESKMTLNEFFPDNKGIFFYKGVRAENKWCDPDFAPLNLETCEGIPLFSSYEVTEDRTGGQNGFLYYNRLNQCKEPEIYGEFMNCCNGLVNNAMAFIATDEGEIGIRVLTNTGECIDHSGTVLYDETPIMEEFYTESGFVEMNTWNHIAIKYEPYNTNRCYVKPSDLGRLSIYINSFLKLQLDGFNDFVPYAHDEIKEKQLGVPYNISFGGGSQGLLEAGMFENTGTVYYDSGSVICDYTLFLFECDEVLGVNVDGQTYMAEQPIEYSSRGEIKNFLESIISQRKRPIEINRDYTFLQTADRVIMRGVFHDVEGIITNNGLRGVCNKSCIELKPHLGLCGYIEDNFAGTFDGGISKVRMYDKPLCYHHIKCNYEIERYRHLRFD